MGNRGWWLLVLLPALVTAGACGDDDDGDTGFDAPDGSGGPIADGGRPPVEDSGPFDCSLPDADGEFLVDRGGPEVLVRGRVFGAALPAPLPGESELEVMRGPDSQLAGATVSIRAADGTVISRDQTGCDGGYVLPAPAESQVFIVVDPIDGPAGGYPGYIESRYVESTGLDQWDMSSGEVGRTYAARTTPHMYVVDAQGVLRYAGAIDDDPRGRSDEPRNYVREVVQALLDGEDPPVSSTEPYGCTVKYGES